MVWVQVPLEFITQDQWGVGLWATVAADSLKPHFFRSLQSSSFVSLLSNDHPLQFSAGADLDPR